MVASLSGVGPPNWETRGPGVRGIRADAVIVDDGPLPSPNETTVEARFNDAGVENIALSFVVPIPPSVNAIWRSRAIPTNRTDRFGRPIYICSVYMTPEGKEWKADAVKAFASSGVRFPEKAKVVVEARVFWPDARSRDFNNLGKVCLDSIQASGVVANDKCILWREVDYEIDRANPRLQLYIYALDEGDKRGKA